MVTFFYENCKIMKSNKLKSRTRLVYTVNNNDFALPVPFSFFNNWFTFLAVFFYFVSMYCFSPPQRKEKQTPLFKACSLLRTYYTIQLPVLHYDLYSVLQRWSIDVEGSWFLGKEAVLILFLCSLIDLSLPRSFLSN